MRIRPLGLSRMVRYSVNCDSDRPRLSSEKSLPSRRSRRRARSSPCSVGMALTRRSRTRSSSSSQSHRPSSGRRMPLGHVHLRQRLDVGDAATAHFRRQRRQRPHTSQVAHLDCDMIGVGGEEQVAGLDVGGWRGSTAYSQRLRGRSAARRWRRARSPVPAAEADRSGQWRCSRLCSWK